MVFSKIAVVNIFELGAESGMVGLEFIPIRVQSIKAFFNIGGRLTFGPVLLEINTLCVNRRHDLVLGG